MAWEWWGWLNKKACFDGHDAKTDERFPVSYVKDLKLRPDIIGEMLLTTLSFQRTARLLTPLELTPAAELEQRSSDLPARCTACSLNHTQASDTYIINWVCTRLNDGEKNLTERIWQIEQRRHLKMMSLKVNHLA